MEYEFEQNIIQTVAVKPEDAPDPKAPLEMPANEPQEEPQGE